MQEYELLTKIILPVGAVILTGVVGGRLFLILAKHFILKYFEGYDSKFVAVFKRIDELRDDRHKFIYIEFRDYKRAVAEEIQNLYRLIEKGEDNERGRNKKTISKVQRKVGRSKYIRDKE